MVTLGTYNILIPQNPRSGHADPYSIGFKKDAQGNLQCNWNERRATIVKNIVSSDLDIVCLQELVRSAVEPIEAALKAQGYALRWAPHEDKASDFQNGLAITYKTNKFSERAVSSKEFRSEHIKHHNGDAKTRRHIILDLQETITGEITRVASCHLNSPRGVSMEHRADQIKAIRLDMEEQKEYAIKRKVIAGDFNQDQWGDRLEGERHHGKEVRDSMIERELKANGYRNDGNLQPTEVTWNKRKPGEPFFKNRHIEWVYVKSDDAVIEPVRLDNFDFKGSDHIMVATKATSKGSAVSQPKQERPLISNEEPQKKRSLKETILSIFRTIGQVFGALIEGLSYSFSRHKADYSIDFPTHHRRRHHNGHNNHNARHETREQRKQREENEKWWRDERQRNLQEFDALRH